MNRVLAWLAAPAGIALAALPLTGCHQSPSPAAVPDATPGVAPAAPASDVSLSCAPADDVAPGGALTSALYPVVTLDTSAFVGATRVDVTVIGFSPSGVQLGTAVITFSGPFAAGQSFQGRGSDMGNVASCGIAAVAADAAVTYDNQSPAQ